MKEIKQKIYDILNESPHKYRESDVQKLFACLDDAYYKGYEEGRKEGAQGRGVAYDNGYKDGYESGLTDRGGYTKGWEDALSLDQELSEMPCEKLYEIFGTDDVFGLLYNHGFEYIRNAIDNYKPPLAIGDEVILPTGDDGVVLSYRADTGTATCLTQDGRVLTFADTTLHRTGKSYTDLAKFVESFTAKGE